MTDIVYVLAILDAPIAQFGQSVVLIIVKDYDRVDSVQQQHDLFLRVTQRSWVQAPLGAPFVFPPL